MFLFLKQCVFLLFTRFLILLLIIFHRALDFIDVEDAADVMVAEIEFVWLLHVVLLVFVRVELAEGLSLVF